ncbi:MAG: phosphoribosyltransferase family protein [Synechococcaceae cyanobacterium]
MHQHSVTRSERRLEPPLWADRHQAGVALAQACGRLRNPMLPVTLVALPRGGVPVAAAMAAELGCPLVTWSVRKVADPAIPEVAIGAVAPGGVAVWRDGGAARRHEAVARSRGWLAEQEAELERRQRLFGDPSPEQLRGRHLVVVDDGIATGMTVEAALLSLRRLEPSRLELAVPVVDRRVAAGLSPLVDRLTVLAPVEDLTAVGLWYSHFEQLSDAQVLELLARVRR